jgi:hypothetical protein
MTLRKIIKFFDRLEDKIRGKLSHYPIFYAFIGGIGVVLFWRGVWHTADDMNMGSVISLIIGGLILLGSRLIISGLIGEKKLTEKEQMEIETEEAQLKNIHSALSKLEKKLDHVETHLETEIEKIEKSKQI